jgi:hypothetical protein
MAHLAFHLSGTPLKKSAEADGFVRLKFYGLLGGITVVVRQFG